MSRNMTKPTKWVCAQRRLRSAWASAQADQSLRCPPCESLGSELPTECTPKTLISLGGLVGWLCWALTSQSTIFQSCRDGAITSWVINQYFRGVKCLAQGHNTAAVGLEPRTSRSGVRHSTTEPPRSPSLGGCPGWSESSLGAHSFCWFCHVAAHINIKYFCKIKSYADRPYLFFSELKLETHIYFLFCLKINPQIFSIDPNAK